MSVIDNRGSEHLIEINENGEIKYHECEDYADNAADRTVMENEHNNQVRRFARYHVYLERGYDTLNPSRNPDRIATAMLAVASFIPDQVRQHFGDTRQQLRSHVENSKPVVDEPRDARQADLRRVGQDIYLSSEKDFISSIEELTETDLYQQLEAAATTGASDGTQLNELQDTLAEMDVDFTESAAHFGDSLIEAVGPVGVRWEESQETDKDVTADSSQPLPDREPDARPQMIADFYDFDTIEGFQEDLVHHLRCQVRDCYIEMGIAPPEAFRVLGPGFYENIGWYRHHEFYPDYYNYHAEIDDWQEEHTPEGLLG
ncbi:hypothetical protein [Natrinema altunense]|nr:hypothetical protein [Natrinema altunense]